MTSTGRTLARRRRLLLGGCAASVGTLLAVGPAVALAQEAPSAWRPPQALTGQGVVASGNATASNAAGTAVVAWLESAPGGDQVAVRARIRLLGGEWGPPVTIAGPAPAAASFSWPAVALDPAGNAMVAWRQAEAEGEGIRAAVRPAATGRWGEPETVASAPAPASGVAAALGPDGTAFLAWSAPLGPGSRGQVAIRPAAEGSWQEPETVSSPGVISPRLSVDAAGTALVSWSRFAGHEMSLRPSGGAWSSPEALPVPQPGFVSQLAFAPDGTILASGAEGVFEEGDAHPIVAQRPPNGAWGPFVRLSGGGFGGLFGLSLDRAGNAVAVGAQSGRQLKVTVAERPAGGAWGPLQVVSDPNRPSFNGRLGVGEGGVAVALWERPEGPRRGLGASYRSSARGSWSAPEDVAPLGGLIRNSAVHVDAAGRALALWEQDNRLRARERAAGTPGRVRLTASQLRINQRIAAAAVRRANALVAYFEAGIRGEDLRPGALLAGDFSPGVTTAGAYSGALRPPRGRRPLEVAPPGREADPIRLSATQLLINQRIGQAAVRRANAIAAMLDAGLTGGNVVDGSIGSDVLAPGISIAASVPEAPAAPARIEVAPPRPGGRATLSARQLLINQRVYQAAIRRLNALTDRVETGLSGADLRPGTISQADLAPELRD